jgi:hypothetical protein
MPFAGELVKLDAAARWSGRPLLRGSSSARSALLLAGAFRRPPLSAQNARD